ncbi:MAG: rRNA maturation RNase YbeY [Eubacterium sp.]|nr:rRNA maturation RNase YbeY [Eubacterium sp.]
MTIEIENETQASFSFDYEETAKNVILASLDLEKFPYEAEVHLLLVDNASIREINREQRGIDKPTDVLSFPMAAYAQPGDFDGLERQPDIFHPDTGEAVLGDIVISVEKAAEQATEYGHGQKREFAFLIAHSMLHLMGYDHMQPEEAAVMEKKQREILDHLKITR